MPPNRMSLFAAFNLGATIARRPLASSAVSWGSDIRVVDLANELWDSYAIVPGCASRVALKTSVERTLPEVGNELQSACSRRLGDGTEAAEKVF